VKANPSLAPAAAWSSSYVHAPGSDSPTAITDVNTSIQAINSLQAMFSGGHDLTPEYGSPGVGNFSFNVPNSGNTPISTTQLDTTMAENKQLALDLKAATYTIDDLTSKYTSEMSTLTEKLDVRVGNLELIKVQVVTEAAKLVAQEKAMTALKESTGEDHRTLEKNLEESRTELEAVVDKIYKADEGKRLTESQITKLKSTIDRVKPKLHKTGVKLQSKTTELQAKKRDLAATKKRVDKLELKNKQLVEKFKSYEQVTETELQTLKQENDALIAKDTKSQGSLKDLSASIKEKELALTTARDSLKAKETQLLTTRIPNMAKTLRSEKDKRMIEKLEKDVAAGNELTSAQQIKMSEISQSNTQLSQDMSKLHSDLDQKDVELKRVTTLYNKLSTSQDKANEGKQIAIIQKKLDGIELSNTQLVVQNKTLTQKGQQLVVQLKELQLQKEQAVRDHGEKALENKGLQDKIKDVEKELLTINGNYVLFTAAAGASLLLYKNNLDKQKSELERNTKTITELTRKNAELEEFKREAIERMEIQERDNELIRQELMDVIDQLNRVTNIFKDLAKEITGNPNIKPDKIEHFRELIVERLKQTKEELEDLRKEKELIEADLNKTILEKDKEIETKNRKLGKIRKDVAEGLGRLANYLLDNAVKPNKNYFLSGI
jgi:DNA repair exonuclease SbcCD ATPase subunit